MNKVLVVFGLIVAMILGWATQTSKVSKYQASLDTSSYLKFAAEQAELGAYGSAIDSVKKANKKNDTYQNHVTLKDYYRDGGFMKDYIAELEYLISEYPNQPAAYDELADYYIDKGDYSEGCSLLKKAIRAGINDDDMKEKYFAYRYMFKEISGFYDDITNFYNGVCVAKKGDKYVYYDSTLKYIAKSNEKYTSADPFFEDLAAVTVNGESYFTDTTGTKYLDSAKKYDHIYSFSHDRAVAVIGDEYYFVNLKFKEVAGPFEDALTFADDMSLIKKEGKWYLIDYYGNITTSVSFDDVIYTSERQATNHSMFFGKQGDSYYLYSVGGVKVCDTAFEDAKPFYEGDYTAVKQNGLWGYVGYDGVISIEPQYEDAQPFGASVGAVKKDGLWGFVIKSNKMVVEPQFEDAKCFGSDKVAPVKKNGAWVLIKFTVSDSVDMSGNVF